MSNSNQPYDAVVAELTLQGKTRAEIKDATGLSFRTIDRSRKRTGSYNSALRIGSTETKYDYDHLSELFERDTPVKAVAEIMGMSVGSVYNFRIRLGYSTPHPMKSLAPHAERLQQAREMVEDGASFREIETTTHVTRKRLIKEFPGKQWTVDQTVDFAVAVRQANRQMRKNGLDIRSRDL